MVEAKASNYEDIMNKIYALYMRWFHHTENTLRNNKTHKTMDQFVAIQEESINRNYAAAQEHVPQVESNNQTIQERVCINCY